MGKVVKNDGRLDEYTHKNLEITGRAEVLFVAYAGKRKIVENFKMASEIKDYYRDLGYRVRFKFLDLYGYARDEKKLSIVDEVINKDSNDLSLVNIVIRKKK